MSDSIFIPDDLNSAVKVLNGVGALLTAKEWERAAIVAAFVRPDFPARAFANLGVMGLTTPASVNKYVNAWLDTHNGKKPMPGAKVKLPKDEFPAMRTGTDGHNTDEGLRTTLKRMETLHGPKAMAEAVRAATPHVADEVRDPHGLRHRDVVTWPHEDPRKTDEWELVNAVDSLEFASRRLDAALEPFDTHAIDPELIDRIGAIEDSLHLLVTLLRGSEVVR